MAQTSGATRIVRSFTRADLAATVATMTRAFFDDPVMSWIFPDEQMRRRQLPRFFTVTMRETCLRQPGTEIVVAGADVLGGAIWLPPGAWRPSLWRQVSTLPSVAWALRSRLGAASATYGAILRQHPERPHWYLSGIGTDPPVQGTGVGTELMRSRLIRCDAAGLPAYLESSKETNVPFYQRHGFRVTSELTIPDGGPTLWLMWREPQKEEAAADADH
jgi:ribosomal protein S18 acetylase RimI-like enzyme